MTFESFVAIGDSFTEGMQDVRPDGSLRGWADLVADAIARQQGEVRYANLALRGRRLHEVEHGQVPRAVAMRPSLITIAAGGNDVIRPVCDTAALSARFGRVLASLVGCGATVVAFAGFDPRVRLPMSGVPGARAQEYNAAIRRAVDEQGAILVDMWDLPRLYEPSMWAPDRLHLSTYGHALVAVEVLRVLGIPSDHIALPPVVEVAPRTWASDRAADLEWGAVHFVRWLVRGIAGRSSARGRSSKRPVLTPVLSDRR